MQNKKKREFSKWLLLQESILIWIMSIVFLILAFYCISKDYLGSLPWLAAMVGFPWTAYGVSQVWYYKKSLAENTKDGIKFETVLNEVKTLYNNQNQNSFSETGIEEIFPVEEDSNVEIIK